MSPCQNGTVTGRRERNRQRTHVALRDAALARFAAQGFEATTVEQIADAADVSTRTFFRYFPCKEAVLFGAEHWEPMLDVLRARPVAEPMLASLRALGEQHWLSGAASDEPRRELRAELIRTNPSVAAYAREQLAAAEPQIVQLAAERLGVDPAVDLRPVVFAQLWASLARFSLAHGRVGPNPTDVFDEWAAALAAVVGNHVPASR
jgi:AcrR family transcriptional regulator